ncbi:hypothetical protein [Nocardia cerradoensis]|uniref:hypothetical protein n=1 Tax=Nocardia cerradoensis TaxID=85688 RepID=UPI0011800AF8|nr:hypothetical protein [Nocardia cerradoensis]
MSSWLGVLEFFGHPPMKIAGFPIWWAAIDALDVVLGGLIVYLLISRLRGWSTAWFVLVPSIALGAASGIVGWPISTPLNSEWGMPAKYLCALASIALSLACLHFLSRALPKVAETVGEGAGGPAGRAPVADLDAVGS